MFYSGPTSPYWVDAITNTLSTLAFLTAFVVAVWAFVHAAMQRPDAFSALGTLTKGTWLALIGGLALLGLFLPVFGRLLLLAALIAALVYLLDIRPAIKEITGR